MMACQRAENGPYSAQRELAEGVRERPSVLTTAAPGRTKHRSVLLGHGTVREAIKGRLGKPVWVTGCVQQKNERSRFNYSYNEPLTFQNHHYTPYVQSGVLLQYSM